ncbi:hypothetical protein [Prosthecobacter vanneervenii]|uniref:Uncharacterized protein n=1 Tax=Prosthecobacter vanneervenii TaxID=48466 RepID=A0A7W7YH24_9BACT|nr:hypothetical protein [Prosthecobacter vanneervenii]MBB5035715.1 hypothetical protein [Prosthecobacter vanneervenii]
MTLESVADHVRVPETRYAPASFTESCAMLEATIRQALVHAEHPDANTLSRRVVLKATTAPEGARAFTAADCTLRELLSRFASTWNISASFSGNQILLSRK